MSAPLRVERDGDVARVTLNRPELHNAFDPELIAALHQAFQDFALPGPGRPRAVVLAGEGRSFSAGADLAWMRSMANYDHDENVADAMRLGHMLRAIRDCPAPVVARVQGAAMGGGAGLVAACDLSVAAEGTRFAFSEVRLGIVPAVISPLVVPKIGFAAARELFLTGERFDAQHAWRIGLVSRVVGEDELDQAVEERLSALAEGAPEAQEAVKGLLNDLWSHPERAREEMARLIAERRSSTEGQEGMAAFLERRSPSWRAQPDEPGDSS